MMAEEVAPYTHARGALLPGLKSSALKSRLRHLGKPGHFAENIEKEVKKQTDGPRVEVRVGPAQGRLVMGDSSRTAMRSWWLARKVGDVPPHPFMRPAFDAKTGEAYDAFEAELNGGWGPMD